MKLKTLLRPDLIFATLILITCVAGIYYLDAPHFNILSQIGADFIDTFSNPTENPLLVAMTAFMLVIIGFGIYLSYSLNKHLELIKTLKVGDKVKVSLSKSIPAEGVIKETKDKSFVVEIEVPHIAVNNFTRKD